MSLPNENDYYALLEVDPGATDEDIRRAYKRQLKRFDPAGVVVYGLYRADEVQSLVRSLREAYEMLVDPEKRRRYDRRIYPEGHPSLRRADQRVAAAPPMPRASLPADPVLAAGLTHDSPLRGTSLTKVREACHLSLEEIAERTKISMFTLRCIEAEQFQDLPARVYMRGFLKQIAEMLRIDPDKLLRDYLSAMEEWQSSIPQRKWDPIPKE
jgi:flagellar biosynthesis protein FlhG